jgi:hypothetical protein
MSDILYDIRGWALKINYLIFELDVLPQSHYHTSPEPVICETELPP